MSLEWGEHSLGTGFWNSESVYAPPTARSSSSELLQQGLCLLGPPQPQGSRLGLAITAPARASSSAALKRRCF